MRAARRCEGERVGVAVPWGRTRPVEAFALGFDLGAFPAEGARALGVTEGVRGLGDDARFSFSFLLTHTYTQINTQTHTRSEDKGGEHSVRAKVTCENNVYTIKAHACTCKDAPGHAPAEGLLDEGFGERVRLLPRGAGLQGTAH